MEENKVMLEMTKAIEETVKPYLKMHQGDIQLLEIDGHIVKVKLYGACSGCPHADQSTREYIEDQLSSQFPWLERVEVINEVSPDLIQMAKNILNRNRQ